MRSARQKPCDDHRPGTARLVLAAGVKLDFRHLPAGYVATARDVETRTRRASATRCKPLEIVLVNTAAGMNIRRADYVDSGCGMGRDATLYLTERGVRVTGTDGWSWDAPFSFTAQTLCEGPRRLDHLGRPQGRPRHRLLPYRETAQSRTPAAHGFMVSCFPVKVKGGSAGWTRAVAIFEE